jgi:hypothetical protein
MGGHAVASVTVHHRFETEKLQKCTGAPHTRSLAAGGA